MAMPGKLCVGILEEDNPLRSYFRFKPLLMEENGRYIPFDEHDRYPDEGCIRIVPDKNESYYFKSRMRQTGLFSVVDLRDHPGENDKIRPNKNYRHGGEEINAYIIYSDVVRGPAPDMIYQLLPVEALQGVVSRPHTPRVLLRQENGITPTCYEWDAIDEAGAHVLLRATEDTCAVADFQVFEAPGFHGETLTFLIKPAALMTAVCDSLEQSSFRHEAQPIPEKREEKPVLRDRLVIVRDRPEPEVVKAPEPEVKKPEPAPAPMPAPATAPALIPVPAPMLAPAPVPAPIPAPVPAPAPVPEPVVVVSEKAEEKPAPAPNDKPWFHHDESMLPPPINPRMSRAEQLLAAQSGLNPRRGRSLQELIDEKWAQSRMNQLGASIAPIATGEPVKNPVDAAVEAVRNAWDRPQLRQELLSALVHNVEGIIDLAKERREVARQSAIAEQLNALEAQRLELLTDIDRLKAAGQQVREQLKQEIRRDEAAAFAEAVSKTSAAQAEREHFETLAAEARLAAEDARATLDQLVGKQLDDKIRDIALTKHVEERLALLKGEAASLPPVPEKLGINAFIDRVLARANAMGWRWTREDAANLCVCLALSSVLLISGGSGSGKTSAARLLTEALGTATTGRAIVCPPEKKPLRETDGVKALNRFPNAPATVILDDANLFPARDALRGAAQFSHPEWRVIATVQDAHSGHPLSANALDRGFMVRLTVPADLPWQPPVRNVLPPVALASIEDIRASMPRAEVPEAIVARMDALRKALADCGANVSRRALDDAWRYCSTMLALMGQAADANALFDRAVAQRILPATLAAAPIEAVLKLRELTSDMPICREWLKQPLPINI